MSDRQGNNPDDTSKRITTFPGGVHRLGAEPGDRLNVVTTPEQRLEILWELTRRSWMLTGRPVPTYERRAMPVVLRHLR